MGSFRESVNRVVKPLPKSLNESICPDQYVGSLRDVDAKAKEFPCRASIDHHSVPRNLVVLILESPHKREFSQPFGPAKGATGNLIRRYIVEILQNRVEDTRGLFILNAVQNQCSLGEPTDRYRDMVFIEAWNSYAKNEFSRRLKKLRISHDLFVVNACTKGQKNTLRGMALT
jgi:hypothetical protein